MKPLQVYWYQSNYFLWLLLPLSWLYCLVVSIRRKLYQLKLKKSFSSDVPVVVVGNIVVGGSGKTPLLIELCERIKLWGYNPGVVSRGYGGDYSGVHQITIGDSASLVGDEPLMIHQRTHVPVVVSADRVTAIQYLLKNNHCDIVLSDDGLQHYRMRRDYEIAVIDTSRRFGNGFCLPAGPLRERIGRLDQVDLLVYNKTDETSSEKCTYTLEFATLNRLNSDESRPISDFINREVHAVAGIGHPQRFFKQLQQYCIDANEHAFPDHHDYQQKDFSGWQNECIIMTEKDAVKCGDLNLPDCWVVIVNAKLSDILKNQLKKGILPLLDR